MCMDGALAQADCNINKQAVDGELLVGNISPCTVHAHAHAHAAAHAAAAACTLQPILHPRLVSLQGEQFDAWALCVSSPLVFPPSLFPSLPLPRRPSIHPSTAPPPSSLRKPSCQAVSPAWPGLSCPVLSVSIHVPVSATVKGTWEGRMMSMSVIVHDFIGVLPAKHITVEAHWILDPTRLDLA